MANSDVQVDEIHRPRERGDPVRDPQLDVRGPSLLFLQDNRVTLEGNRQVKLGHPGASISV